MTRVRLENHRRHKKLPEKKLPEFRCCCRSSETYIGLTETDFKTRHRNHTASFRHAKHKNSTELSKHIWTLKNDNIDYSISWRVLSSNSPYNSSSKRCNLCLKEKFLIIYRPDLSSLNKRNELVSSCRHRNKALLRNS